jgi:hypothetical protein
MAARVQPGQGRFRQVYGDGTVAYAFTIFGHGMLHQHTRIMDFTVGKRIGWHWHSPVATRITLAMW